MIRPAAALALLACLSAAPALAQTTPPVASGLAPSPASPTQGIPPATGGAGDRTGSVAATGQTKPPGEAAPGTRPDLEQKSKQLDEKINRGICRGCGND